MLFRACHYHFIIAVTVRCELVVSVFFLCVCCFFLLSSFLEISFISMLYSAVLFIHSVVCSFYSFHFHLLLGAIDTHWLSLQIMQQQKIRRKKCIHSISKWKIHTNDRFFFYLVLFHIHTLSTVQYKNRSNEKRDTEHCTVITDRLVCNILIDHCEVTMRYVRDERYNVSGALARLYWDLQLW